MANHIRAWLRRKLKSSGKKQHQEAVSGGRNPPTAAANTRKDCPPPEYDAQGFLPESIHQTPRSTEGSESLEILRARNPATRPLYEDSRILCAPRHETRPIAAAKAAASAAVIGMIGALDESDPNMVAARTAQAIAVAVSTSRSYGAFVAAVTAAESCALLLAEDTRHGTPLDRCEEHTRNAFHAAVDTAMAADAGLTPIGAWPFNIYDTQPLESSSGTAVTFENCSYAPPSK